MTAHPIVHIEFSATDRRASAKFYSDVFSWETKDYPEMNYTTFAAEGGPGGGFNPVGERNPAGTVLVYIFAEDIEGTLAKVQAGGGKILAHEAEIPGVGWWGEFEDPGGNRIALFKNKPM